MGRSLKPDRKTGRSSALAPSLCRVVAMALAVVIAASAAHAQDLDVAKYFKQNCSNCHWIGGGRLVGPDLRNVTGRQDRDWLVRFIFNPKAVLDARDPYVMKLKDEAKGAIMTNVPGMTREMAEALLDLIEAESQLDSSQFAGNPALLEPFSDSVATKGMALFMGRRPLAGGGAACVSCHSINAPKAALGGQLGPDLTGVFQRLRGRTALQSWLLSPPTPTMRSVFKTHPMEPDETKALAMFFESASGKVEYNSKFTLLWLALIFCGVGGSAVGMVFFGGIWSNRFRAVRRPLVNQSKDPR